MEMGKFVKFLNAIFCIFVQVLSRKFEVIEENRTKPSLLLSVFLQTDQMWPLMPGGGGGTFGISGWGCATGTLEPLTYTRASSPEFCYPILELTPQIPPILE